MGIGNKTRGKIVGGGLVTSGNAGYPSGTGVSAIEGAAGVHKTVITIKDYALTMTDNGSKLHGGFQYYTFAEGSIVILGATTDLSIVVSGGLNTNADGDCALGTIVADAGAALTGNDANICPKTTVSCASFAATNTMRNAAAIAPLDGTGTAIPTFINYTFDTGAYTSSGIVTISGTITMLWSNLGDY